jgi:hypothetical protein
LKDLGISLSALGKRESGYDNSSSSTLSFSRETTADVTSGFSATLTVKDGGDALGIAKVSQQLSFTYTTTTTQSDRTDVSATVTLSTLTRDCTADYLVYYDALFNTLAFQKQGTSAPACQ